MPLATRLRTVDDRAAAGPFSVLVLNGSAALALPEQAGEEPLDAAGLGRDSGRRGQVVREVDQVVGRVPVGTGGVRLAHVLRSYRRTGLTIWKYIYHILNRSSLSWYPLPMGQRDTGPEEFSAALDRLFACVATNPSTGSGLIIRLILYNLYL